MLPDQTIIHTPDDCYFTVIGNIHPPGKKLVGLLSYIPYEPWHETVPHASRKEIDGRIYTKISRAWFGPGRNEYLRQLKRYEHYLYADKFFGLVTAVPEGSGRVIRPASVSGVAVKACEMLGIPPESAVLVGSSMIEGCNDHADIDLGVVGRAAVSRAIKRLRQLIANPKHQVYHDYFGRAHPRQFLCEGRKIDLFPLHSENDARPQVSYTSDVEGPVLVEDTVTDASDGAFRPSFYKLAGGVPLVTFDIEHRMILHKHDRIKVRAWRTPQAFLVRFGDPYQDITARYRFIGKVDEK